MHPSNGLLCSSVHVIASSLHLFSPNRVTVLRHSLQDSELKRTVDESERIKRAYGHYFDLCIINDGLEAAFRSLRLALEKLSTEQQWVPVSWVFWKSPPAHQQGAGASGRRSEDDLTRRQPQRGFSEGPSVMIQCRWPASRRAFLYKLSVSQLSLMSSCDFIFPYKLELFYQYLLRRI